MKSSSNNETVSTRRVNSKKRCAPQPAGAAARTTPDTAGESPQVHRQKLRRKIDATKSSDAKAATIESAVVPPPARRPSKLAMIESLIRRPGGANIAELCDATAWQSHSIRAALTGLRKGGQVVQRERGEGDTTRYCIADATATG